MHLGRALLLTATIVAPFSIETHEHGDTLATVTMADGTQFEIAGGTGVYAFVSRGCNGQIIRSQPVSFRDAAVRVQQPIGSQGFAIGVRAGIVRHDFAGGDGLVTWSPYTGGPQAPRVIETNRYVNPYVTIERPNGSFGFGWVAHEHEFPTAGEGAREQTDHPANDVSLHLRGGSERHYFEIRWMESMPLDADGGYLNVGIGGRPAGGPWTVFGGLGAGGPYEGAGIALRAGRDVGDWNVGARSRLGWTGDSPATGVALGVTYAHRKR